jgi:hypothetical protein
MNDRPSSALSVTDSATEYTCTRAQQDSDTQTHSKAMTRLQLKGRQVQDITAACSAAAAIAANSCSSDAAELLLRYCSAIRHAVHTALVLAPPLLHCSYHKVTLVVQLVAATVQQQAQQLQLQ